MNLIALQDMYTRSKADGLRESYYSPSRHVILKPAAGTRREIIVQENLQTW